MQNTQKYSTVNVGLVAVTRDRCSGWQSTGGGLRYALRHSCSHMLVQHVAAYIPLCSLSQGGVILHINDSCVTNYIAEQMSGHSS